MWKKNNKWGHLKMRITKSYIGSEKDSDRIIIYGAGRYGELALRGLQALGIEPYAFADQSLVGQDYFGVRVISPDDLINYRDAVILIASYNYFYEMLSFLHSIGHEKIYDILDLIRMDYDESILSEYVLDEKHNWKKYAGVVDHAEENGIVMTHLELVLTERCTLRCKDCANLIQYYKSPEKLNTDVIIKEFNRFINSIDILLELRLLGGEPFLCENIDKIIDEFSGNEKIKRITIYTNSTIIPSDKVLECLKKNKVSVHMSNYGKVSYKLIELENVLSTYGISHYVHDYEKWYDLGGIEKRNHSKYQLEMMYKTCLMSKCYTFYRGKFYLCPRAAHGETLGIYKNPEAEFVDFTKDVDIEVAKERIKELINDTEYIIACDYCNGSSSRSKVVDAGIQVGVREKSEIRKL